ncbi:stage V sporulation protein AB [Paenibacillus sp. 1P07SE]|uniref:stage V sporulation protein AB n=1 Tax=Paenibacillus sp. 1P07SE TaxID=3132209 RepID=UPI0039A76B14
MIDGLAYSLLLFLGLAGGIAVGSGMVALLVILDLIPRLAQLARAYQSSIWFESAIIAGSVYWSFADFLGWRLHVPGAYHLASIGLIDGVFVGMLAAALTEVLNVLPILAKRLKLSHYMVALVMAMVFGKVTGSLFDWLVFQW